MSFDNCLDIIKTANKLGYTKNSILKLLKKKIFPNAFKISGNWLIPTSDIKRFQQSIHYINEIEFANTEEGDSDSNNFFDIKKLKVRLTLSEGTIKSLIHQKQFPNAFKYKQRWWVPLNDVRDFEQSLKKEKNKKLNCLSTKDAAKKLGYGSHVEINQLIVKYNRFPNAFKRDGRWWIPNNDIEQFEMSLQRARRKIDYTGTVAFKELKEFIDSIQIKKGFKESKQLFIDYCLLQTNNMQGTNRYRRDRVLLFQRFYKNLVTNSDNEVFFLSSGEIEQLLDDKSPFSNDQKVLFTRFLNYTYSIKNIKPDEEFIIKRNRNNDTKDIYSPITFHHLYEYAKAGKTHTPFAIKDRHYVNMWVYNILLLTDFIRGQDLILKTPNIDLKEINIFSLDWFFANELSEYQAQLVINQLYIHFRHKRTNKTDELLTFIVAPDLIFPLATALVISELHRKMEQSNTLLETFIQGSYDDIITYGKIKHKKYFNGNENFTDFHFSSRKMNRSVSTYLFYSITEEDGHDSELALHLTQNARSHKSSDTTSEYIQSTNQDGSINRVSYNLFRRGLFGWLYNYLILFVTQNQKLNNTLEERTQLIEGIREEISPSGLENISEFVDNHLNLAPLDKDSTNMDNYLHTIYEKRRSIISKLKDYSSEEIQDILKNLALGKMPSKNEHAQCLVFPNCKYPKLSNCYSCEYVIPGNLFLIQLKEEFKRLTDNIESYSNEILIKRDSKFLLHTLFLWKEARLTFGDKRVVAFLPTKDTWGKIESLSHKLYLE